MSFYSPIDRLAQTLPRPKGTGSEFMTELSKMPGYKSQEAEDRGLQALVNLPKMERAQFLEALKAKPPVTPKAREMQTTQHEFYTLPGGTNYREILLQHPNPQDKFAGASGHFAGAPNILASVRVKDRVGPNGEKIFHIDELQSDWHQQGREKGYRPAGQSELLTGEPYKIAEDEYGIKWSDGSVDDAGYSERYATGLAERGKLTEKVPEAPFKKNWHEMALKKMIHHAAKNGYDSIAITPGAEQAKRYRLSKHVSDIRYDPYYKQLIATGHRGEAINKIAEPHELSNYVGKDVAEKLLQTPISQGMHKLSGLDLESGGEGMKGFYDKMIPSFLNQFGKKYGAKVGQGQINIDDPNGHSQTEMLRASGIPEQNWGQLSYPQKQQMMAEYSAKQPPKMASVHTFPITPAMREDVTKNGVPLYAKGGSVEDDEPKKTVKAYKMFRVDKKQPGKLFPLFVDSNTPVEMDKWITAKEGERSTANTKKVKSKIGDLAYRPGWHAGDLPIATHIGDKDEEQKAEARRVRELRDAYAATMGSTKAAKALARKEHPYPSWVNAPRLRNPNHIWAEVEMPDDVDWQSEATKRGYNDQGKLIASQAHITDQLPLGGHYRYKTNSNMLGNWLIGGSMKVKRILHDKEVEAINKAAGAADLPRAKAMNQKSFGFAKGGTVGPDEWMAEEHVNHMAKGGKVSREMHDANLAKFLAESKVKDRLYHATNKDFKSFRPNHRGAHFVTPSAEFADSHLGDYQGYENGENIMPVYVQAKNPFDYENLQNIKNLFRQAKKDRIPLDKNWKQGILEGNWDSLENEKLMRSIKNLGHDSMYVSERDRWGEDAKNLAVFRPEQIKSAIGNRGTYDLNDPDITKAKGGSIKPVGYTKERVTVSPNLDAMRYEMESVKHYSKKVK